MGDHEMMLDEAAHELANQLAKHFIGEGLSASDETCSKCISIARAFLREQYERGHADAAPPLAAFAR